jgi:hypothetical protein
MNRKNRIKLTVGDPSGDGHNETRDTVIETNFDINEILEAYEHGCELLGIDLEQCCVKFNDQTIPTEVVAALNAKGLKHLFEISHTQGEAPYWTADPDSYTHAWMRIAKYGNPKFAYAIVTDKIPSIDIGGYGVFYF